MFDLWALCVGGAALPWSGPSPRISYDLWALCISGVAMQRVGEAFYQNFFYLWALCVGGLALLRVGEAFYQNFFYMWALCVGGLALLRAWAAFYQKMFRFVSIVSRRNGSAGGGDSLLPEDVLICDRSAIRMFLFVSVVWRRVDLIGEGTVFFQRCLIVSIVQLRCFDLWALCVGGVALLGAGDSLLTQDVLICEHSAVKMFWFVSIVCRWSGSAGGGGSLLRLQILPRTQ